MPGLDDAPVGIGQDPALPDQNAPIPAVHFTKPAQYKHPDMVPFKDEEIADWMGFKHKAYIDVDHTMFQKDNVFEGQVPVDEDVQPLDQITWNYIDEAEVDPDRAPVKVADPQPIQPERTPAMPPRKPPPQSSHDPLPFPFDERGQYLGE